MALVPATLASGLEAMEPTDTEAIAIDNFVAAWEDYFSGASVAGIAVAPGTLAGALSTMRGALTGLSTSEAGANLIQAAVTAFWGVVAASAATIWVVVPSIISATVPPTLGTIGVTLTGVFAANQSGALDLAASANAVALAIHPTQRGGVTSQGPPPTSGTII